MDRDEGMTAEKPGWPSPVTSVLFRLDDDDKREAITCAGCGARYLRVSVMPPGDLEGCHACPGPPRRERREVFGRADYEEWLKGSDVFKANPDWGADAGHSAPGPCRSCGIRIAQFPRLLPRDCWSCFPAHARR